MQNSLINLFFFPELIFSIGIIIILLIGLFSTKNVFSITSNLSSLLLLTVFFVIIFNGDFNNSYFSAFFTESNFITYFQSLVLLGSLFTKRVKKGTSVE